MKIIKTSSLVKAVLCLAGFFFFGFSYALGIQQDTIQFLFKVRGIKENHPFCRPQGIFVHDSQKKIYVADTDNHEIAVFSFSGESLGTVQTEPPLSGPVALAIDTEGRMYISQRGKDFLEVFGADGNFLYTIPAYGSSKGPEFSPGRMDLSPEGKIYVVNKKKAQIWVFEKDGSFAFCFGGQDFDKINFQFITDIFFHNGKVYITDAQGVPLHVFTSEGKHKYSLGKHGLKKEDFSFPRAVSIDAQNRLWVLDAFRHKINVYNQEGSFLFQFGSFGKEDGNLCFPVDLDFDHENRLYILEKGGDRFQVFGCLPSRRELKGNKKKKRESLTLIDGN